jgi:hypothetical protein
LNVLLIGNYRSLIGNNLIGRHGILLRGKWVLINLAEFCCANHAFYC